MIRRFMAKTKHFLLMFCYTQLFLTLVMLPVIVLWGLPISLLSFIGNLWFSPVITLFLLLSSLIFFFELLYIPNQWLIYPLEWVTQSWLWFMDRFGCVAYVGCVVPSIAMVCIPALAALAIIHAKAMRSLAVGVFALAAVACVTLFYLHVCAVPASLIKDIPCRSGQVTLIKQNAEIVVIDPGVVGRTSSASSWLEYTLLSELNKHCASHTIDHMVVMSLTKTGLQAYAHLLGKAQVKRIYIPAWKGKIPRDMWFAYVQLKRKAQEMGCQLCSVGAKEVWLGGTQLVIKSKGFKKSSRAYKTNAYYILGMININGKEKAYQST